MYLLSCLCSGGSPGAQLLASEQFLVKLHFPECNSAQGILTLFHSCQNFI